MRSKRMVPSSFFTVVIAVLAVLSTGAHAATCSSQKLVKKFENCLDLPHLGAFLHYTYDAANTSISIAFIAKPPTATGWIAWGINPVDKVMEGTQAFVAYKENDVVVAKTYDVRGMDPSQVVQGPISFPTWSLSSESFGSSGEYVIYGSAKVPKASQKNMNHVWQVGPSVSKGQLTAHAMAEDNLSAVDTILLVTSSNSPSPSPSPSKSNGTSPSPSPSPLSSLSPSPSPTPISTPTPSPSPSPSLPPSPAPSPSPSVSNSKVHSPSPSPSNANDTSSSSSPAPSGRNGSDKAAPASSMSDKLRLKMVSVFAGFLVLCSFMLF